MIAATEALERLRAGNQRFVEQFDTGSLRTGVSHAGALVSGQEPFAILLGCSDSRVPGELIFDQGLGDLFVIRVAGNIAAPSQIGSVEFAADRFGTRLIVVLGHSGCGAIQASLDAVQSAGSGASENLNSIVRRISPAVERVLARQPGLDREAIVARAVRENIAASVEQLRTSSAVLESLVENDGLRIVGAEYSLATGRVDFLDEA